MKNSIKLSVITIFLSLSVALTAFGGTWEQDSDGWRWLDKGQPSLVSVWKWIDSNLDGMAECYYFDETGHVLTDTITPDGYQVNENGAWISNDTIQQKAMNPSAASQAKQQGKELYLNAIKKSSDLADLDVSGDIQMMFFYPEFEIPAFIKLNQKYHNINTPDMEFLLQANRSMMGLKNSRTAFYTDGTYYTDQGPGNRYKMKIGHQDMIQNLALGHLTGQFYRFLDHVQISEKEDGSKIIVYTNQSEGLEPYLENINNQIWPVLNDADLRIQSIQGKAVLTPEGYFSSENITIDLISEEDEDTVTLSMNIHLVYHNPGENVRIDFPSSEGYEVVVY